MKVTVRTFTRPSTTRIATPGSGPTAARAIGRARMVTPIVSVSVSEYAVQNGGRLSSRAARALHNHRSRSEIPARAEKMLSSGSPYRRSYAWLTSGSSSPSAARRPGTAA
jgi:hypothetical protein